MIKKDLEYYLKLPYKVVLYPAEEGGYAVEIPELPGCISQGQTLEEAYEMIQDAKKGWLDIALQDGETIPEPARMEEYSGKFNIRMPKSLHRTLVAKAKEENVSLNQYINYQLARSVGHPVK
ncbi:type II toxin-antitoxin system HicB family antitoxin [Pelotomaculum terephthalicicum JT]|uniref:type II toxin-antitoxin system HicB family antitoxin n=1 Tax=Pelotomaculum TaxID=191373 RepID=UPI0009D2145C|nr:MULTISPECIES: type II toxin-antitoxin system HicB family antitoxin [Pelotomaculum]MCG9966872.1 type II toxin-antitoxin system HicB family antitoxin [Pelotomaculum terephthalicicum JT]OPX87982.1 MAG: Antitoxin HicB [Pelotomaculum sp. PtaB.Bin117]OPY61394.1 MAG: Antitoxin HicB [Pelotomaculum sp. PtaU1.Bin065]